VPVWIPRLPGEERTGRVHGVDGWYRTRPTSAKNMEQRTMRKAEIIQRIAQELECTTAKAEAAVEAILTTIKASLQQGEPVILRRFGTWQVRAKRARVGRNPKTGAAAAIPARRVVRFLAGQPFKQGVAGAAHLVE
jgi:integration host factor subunit alpha